MESAEWFRWGISLVIVVASGIFGWIINRLFKRQDELFELKANKESTDSRFEELIGELRQQRQDLKSHETEDRAMHKDVLVEIRETNRHLSTTNATLSNLVGRFDASNGHRPSP